MTEPGLLASALIERLQSMIAKHGDFEVRVPDVLFGTESVRCLAMIRPRAPVRKPASQQACDCAK